MIYSTLAENAKAAPRTFTQIFPLILPQEAPCSFLRSLIRLNQDYSTLQTDPHQTHLPRSLPTTSLS